MFVEMGALTVAVIVIVAAVILIGCFRCPSRHIIRLLRLTIVV